MCGLFISSIILTLNLLILLNAHVLFPFLEQYFINFKDIENEKFRLVANSIETGQTAQKCRLAWLYTGGKD